jgi:nucleoside-specific outer membrane channel protein Tsx
MSLFIKTSAEAEGCNDLIDFLSRKLGLGRHCRRNFKSRNIVDLIVEFWFEEVKERGQEDGEAVKEVSDLNEHACFHSNNWIHVSQALTV